MTLAELGFLVNADRKWVLNTIVALGLPKRYSLVLARQLAVTRAIHESSGIPLVGSHRLATGALLAYRGQAAPLIRPTDNSEVCLVLDIRRLLSSFAVRLSVQRSMSAPQRRGRPASRRRDPLQAASAWGLDLTLLADNMARTAEQRLRQLDAMAAFAHGVQRLPAPPA